MSERMMGHLGWSEPQLRAADLNAIEVAWRGYMDKIDDEHRLIWRSVGVKYPDKPSRKPPPPVSFSKRMRQLGRRPPKTE